MAHTQEELNSIIKKHEDDLRVWLSERKITLNYTETKVNGQITYWGINVQLLEAPTQEIVSEEIKTEQIK